jgi:hypothetical protein
MWRRVGSRAGPKWKKGLHPIENPRLSLKFALPVTMLRADFQSIAGVANSERRRP